MNAARNIEPDLRLKVAQFHVEKGDWVHSLAPWQVISHMTFAWEVSVWSAQRCYEKFIKREVWGVSYFYALEENPGRDGYHVSPVGSKGTTPGRNRSLLVIQNPPPGVSV